MARPESADDLRTRLDNYERSRRAAAKSMYHWLDGLIADARERLRRLNDADDDDGISLAAAARPMRPPPAGDDPRAAFPFDEQAPPQRFNGY